MSAEEAGASAASDKELVVQSQAGDASAFEELVRRNHTKVLRLATYLCHGHDEDGEETAQNALLKAYRHLGSFRGESQFSTWVTRIVINECRAYQQSQRRLPRGLNLDDHLGEEGDIPVELVDGSSDPEIESAWHEFHEILQQYLAELPELYRTPFVLSRFEGLSNEEIAARLGLSLSNTKNRVLRARRWLQRRL